MRTSARTQTIHLADATRRRRRVRGLVALLTLGSLALTAAPASAAVPTVTSISPQLGPTSAGSTVTINGTNLSGATGVTFGGAGGTIGSNTGTSMSVQAPAGSAGTVDARVTTPAGTSVPDPQDEYTYDATPQVLGLSPQSGLTDGGTSITIYGQGFVDGHTTVTFGGATATVSAVTPTSITAVSPSGSAGAVDVQVTTPGGESAANAQDHFTYGLAVPGTPQLNEAGLTQVAITWPAAVGVGTSGYTVCRGGVAVGNTDSLTTNYLDTGLTSNTPYTYTVVVGALSLGTSCPSGSGSLPVPTARSATVIGNCRSTPLGSGNYVLGGNVSTSDASSPCLTFDASNVSLDCGPYSISPAPTDVGIQLEGVSHFLVANCDMSGTNFTPMNLTNSSDGTIAGDQMLPSTSLNNLSVSGGSGVVFGGDVLTNTDLTFNGAQQEFVGHSHLTLPDQHSDTGFLLQSQAGAQNIFDGDTIDGGAPQTSGHVGSDDGIVLGEYNTTGDVDDVVANNHISDVWDAGIETLGLVTNTQILDNTVSAALITGIGTYHETSWVNDAVVGNTVTNSGSLFVVTANNGDPPLNDAAVHLEDNTFSDNTLTSVGGTPDTHETMFGQFTGGSDPFTFGANALVGNTWPATASPTIDPPNLLQSNLNSTCATWAGVPTDLLCGAGSPTAPTVTGVTPGSTSDSGASVTINGTGFTGATAVTIGSAQNRVGYQTHESCVFAPSDPNCFTVVSNASITVNVGSASGTLALLDVQVTDPGGTSATSPAATFSFEGAPTITSVGPSSGGGRASVKIVGANLDGPVSVTFGSAAATVNKQTPTSLTVTSPLSTPGTVDVHVTTGVGATPTTSADQYTYTVPPLPSVTSLSPSTGSTGSEVLIKGSNLQTATKVLFGTHTATAFIHVSSSQLLAIAPAGSGTVDVTVTNTYGTSATTSGDRFTY